MIWWKEALMAAVGLCSGLAVAGGLFALIIALGLVAKFADQTHTARYILLYEDAVAAGGILGNLVSIYSPSLPFGDAGVGIFGICGRLGDGTDRDYQYHTDLCTPHGSAQRTGAFDSQHGAGTDCRSSYFLFLPILGTAVRKDIWHERIYGA